MKRSWGNTVTAFDVDNLAERERGDDLRRVLIEHISKTKLPRVIVAPREHLATEVFFSLGKKFNLNI